MMHDPHMCFKLYEHLIRKVHKGIFRLSINRSSNQLGNPINSRRFATKMSVYLKNIPEVKIDESGTFKYMLFNVHDKSVDKYKQVVRGTASATWHDNIYSEIVEELKSYHYLEAESMGGGRIEHDPEKKVILVFGNSEAYGRADHEISIALLKNHYTDYTIHSSDTTC